MNQHVKQLTFDIMARSGKDEHAMLAHKAMQFCQMILVLGKPEYTRMAIIISS